MRRLAILAVLLTASGGCGRRAALTPPAPAIYPAAGSAAARVDYRMGPLDEVSIVVFREPELTLQTVIDANGKLAMPLVGQMVAEGRTTPELAGDIADRLRRYLIKPDVTVSVTRATSLRVTVDGRVRKPGIYDVDGRTTLLQSVARAEGETETAALSDVVVFRRIEGRQFAARFDVRAIRGGRAEDPVLRGGDVVIVGSSAARGLYQDFLKVAPFLGTVFIAVTN